MKPIIVRRRGPKGERIVLNIIFSDQHPQSLGRMEFQRLGSAEIFLSFSRFADVTGLVQLKTDILKILFTVRKGESAYNAVQIGNFLVGLRQLLCQSGSVRFCLLYRLK